MTRLFKIALLSLAVVAGAGSAYAGGSSVNDENFSPDAYWEYLQRIGA